MKCAGVELTTVFLSLFTVSVVIGAEIGKTNAKSPANDQMCEIASLEMLSYSRCDLMTRVQTLELLVQSLLEQLSNELPIVNPETPERMPKAEKRKNEFIRFGKRKNEFIRFGKRKNEFIRFGRSMQAQNLDQNDQEVIEKRKNEFIRFG